MQQEIHEGESPFKYILMMAYTHVFGNHQLQSYPKYQTKTLYQYMISFLKKINVCKDMFPIRKADGKLTDFMKIEKQRQFIYLEKFVFGAIIIIEKIYEESYPEVYIVFPSQWQLGMGGTVKNTFYFPDPSMQNQHLYIGRVNDQSVPLNYLLEKISHQLLVLEKQIKENSREYNKKNHHTPSWLAQALKFILNKINSEKHIKSQNSIIQSKGGTLDVGTHTGTTKPDIIFAATIALIDFCLQNKDLTMMVVFSYKIHLLQKFCEEYYEEENQTNKNNVEIRDLLKCLLDLRGDYFKIVSHNNQYCDKEKVQHIFKQLYQTITSYIPEDPGKLVECEQMGYISKPDSIGFNDGIFLNYQHQQNMIQNKSFFQPSKVTRVCESDIFNYYGKSVNHEDSGWVLLFEDAIFSLAIEKLLIEDSFLCFKNQVFSAHKNSHSTAYYCLEQYCRCQDIRPIGIVNSKSQIQSHKQLVKMLVSIFAFENYKSIYKKTAYSVDQFRVPNQIQQLLKNFHSFSFKAREAAKVLYLYHLKQKNKVPFFDVKAGFVNFKIYASKVTKQTDRYDKLAKQKVNDLKSKMGQLVAKIKKARVMATNNYNAISKWELKQCGCQTNEVVRTSRKKKKIVQYIVVQCQRCKQIQKLQSQISSKRQNEIIANIPSHNVEIHQFFRNLDPHLNGLINIMVYSQSDNQKIKKKQSKKNKSQFNQVKLWNSKELCFETVCEKPHSFNPCQFDENLVENLVKYSKQQVRLKWNGQNCSTVQFNNIQAYQESNKKEKSNILYEMLKLPKYRDENAREHLIYSQLNIKPINLSIEKYIGLGSIRIGLITQIPIILDQICHRKIKLNILDVSDYWPIIVIQQAISQLQINSLQDLQKNSVGGFQINLLQYFEGFLDKYMELWSSQDFLALPVLAPVFSLIYTTLAGSKHLYLKPIILQHKNVLQQKPKLHSIFTDIIDQIFRRFDVLEEDRIEELSNSSIKVNDICTNQSFLCMSGLLLFTESILSSFDPICELFLELHMLVKHKEIYTSGNNSYSQCIRIFKNTREILVMKNIDQVLEYFKQNPDRLNCVLPRIIMGQIKQQVGWTQYFQGIFKGKQTSKTKWSYQSQYIFKGVEASDTYKIDIKSGVLIKNDNLISGLPTVISQNHRYQNIFGIRQFEVMKANDFSFVTNHTFKEIIDPHLQPKKQVRFQFRCKQKPNLGKTQLFILMKFDDEKWTYAETSQLLYSQKVPPYYLHNFDAWINTKRRCVVYRRKQLKNMHIIGAVMFYYKNKIQSMRSISQEQNNFTFQEICDRGSSSFDKIIMKSIQEKDTIAYKVLNQIEDFQYIIELQGEKNTRKFWLHRFQLTCIQRKQGLFLEMFKDYRICRFPHKNVYVPWSTNQVPYIVLQKFNNDNELSFGLHQIKIFVPESIFFNDYSNVNAKRIYFSYEIHDHFKRLFGLNRQSQLYLALILIKTNQGHIIEGINLTSSAYSLQILEGCLNNIPLTQFEITILNQIKREADQQKNHSIFLICHTILPQTLDQYSDAQYQEYVQYCMNAYNWRIRDRTLPIREQLSQRVCKILGLKYIGEQSYGEGTITINNLKNSLKPNISLNPELIKMCDEALLEAYNQKKHILNCKKPSKINKEKQFPINIESLSQSVLARQIMMQLKQSYKSYLQEEYQINGIQIKKSDLSKFENIEQKLLNCINKVEQVFSTLSQTEHHIDVISGYRPILSYFDFVAIVNNEKKLQTFFPSITSKQKQYILSLLKSWMKMKVQAQSYKRIQILTNQEQIDMVTLLRQLQSPREQIEEKMYWVCFQVEMKLQIWISQFETFSHIFKNGELQNGSIPQLNMGQGKTQTIIPMIILQLRYGPTKLGRKIPRINLLTSIFNESVSNYYRFFSISGFQIPVLSLPFNRNIQLGKQRTLKGLQRTFNYFGDNMILLIDQSSLHSIILKLRETAFKTNGHFETDKQNTVFKRIQCVDIFDEVDALMTPNKSFIYSIGKSNTLDCIQIRANLAHIIIEIACLCIGELHKEGLVILDQTFDAAQYLIKFGKFPKGFRIISNDAKSIDKIKLKFRKIIIDKVFQVNHQYEELRFLSKLSPSLQKDVRIYMMDEQAKDSKLSAINSWGIKKIYMLRGILAYGVLEHCLQLRCTVNYGPPDNERINRTGKNLAVPYEASNIPSKNNDYAQPDVVILLSYFAYYSCGINFKNFKEGILKLFDLTKYNLKLQEQIFSKWCCTLTEAEEKLLKIKSSTQIKIDSNSQMTKLYEVLKFNRKFIDFWLVNCVFPKDMLQYRHSIISSTWDHASTKHSLGFSGTKDMHRLFPTYLNYENSANLRIRGTDGKMLDMLLENTLDIQQVKEGDEPLWKRYLNTVLNLPKEYKVSCIIDLGALLAGTTLKDEIIPWLSNHKYFSSQRSFKGISFCHDNKWMAYQFNRYEFVQRGLISDAETFVVFDQYRTRGSDMKMSHDITGVVSLSSFLNKDSLMQAAGRLRKIGRNQKIVFIITSEVKNNLVKSFGYHKKLSIKEKVKVILNWVCINSMKQTQKLFFQNSRLAKIHLSHKQTLYGTTPKTMETETDLESMYRQAVEFQSVEQISDKMFDDVNFNDENKKKVEQIIELNHKYGSKTLMKVQNFDQVREKQIETEVICQKEKVNEGQDSKLLAYRQTDEIIRQPLSIYEETFNFTNKLEATNNFRLCTCLNKKNKNQEEEQITANEIAVSHFLYLTVDNIIMITIRQANILLSKNIPFYPLDPSRVDLKSQVGYIARLCDLNSDDMFLKKNNLIEAIVHCKFYNGEYNYSKKQLNIIKNLLKDRDQQELNHYLIRRKTEQYYRNSSLQQLYNDLIIEKKQKKIQEEEW